MDKIITKIDQLITTHDFSLASNFSYDVNQKLLNEINNHIAFSLANYSLKVQLTYLPNIMWLDEGWEIIELGNDKYKIGLFIEAGTSNLIVSICEFFTNSKLKNYKRTISVKNNGKIKHVVFRISAKIEIDHEKFCQEIVSIIEKNYKHALIDYQAALRDFCLASAGDDFYDVLRKSAIHPLVQKHITLYCVYEAMGRHIPSIERVTEIVSKIQEGLPSSDLDPLRLAMDFFLSPLDGHKYELYTQKAFRSNQPMLATRNNYSGTSYVRLATEAFFQNSDVYVHPITKAGDENWLLSAIYPTRFYNVIYPEIEKQLDTFHEVVKQHQNKNRDILDKLKHFTLKTKNTIDNPTILGKVIGGVISALSS